MANERSRADLATAGVGYGLVATGAGASAHGISRLKSHVGLKDLHSKPLPAMIAARRIPKTKVARGLYFGGRGLTALGGVGAVAGTQSYIRDHKVKKLDATLTKPQPEHHNLLVQGLEGNVAAVKNRVKPDKPTPLKAHIMNLGLGAAAAAVGSKGAAHFTSHLPIRAVAGVAAGSATLPLNNKINNHFKVKSRRKPVKPSSKASTIEARPSRGADARQARASIVPVTKMNDASEVHVNGVLEATGRKRLKALTPYELQNTRGRVKKLDNGYTAAEARRQLGRRKRKLVADVASTGLGVGGLALLGASHPASGLKAAHRARLARAAGTTAVLGGGIGGIQGIQGVKISRHDIKAQQSVLKALGVPRIPGFRSSYMQTRRLRNGTLKPVRINGGVVR